jgi:hypothetical protein
MDNSNKAIAKRLTELEKIVRNLLADAPWKQHEKNPPDEQQTRDEQEQVNSCPPTLPKWNPPQIETNNARAKWYNSLK